MSVAQPSRAISIRQPWVELILRGVKVKEHRSQPTNIRERVFIYASMKPAEGKAAWRRLGKQAGDLLVGQIVGSIEIVDCRLNPRSGEYDYILRNPRRLQVPLTPKNQPAPRFWRPRF
jgi:hypothetical protein